MTNNKLILDVCCGPKMFYFNKQNPNVLYQDIRQEEKGYISIRPSCEVKPDLLMDFREMSHPDKSFKMVVFDPPHLLAGGEQPTHPLYCNNCGQLWGYRSSE